MFNFEISLFLGEKPLKDMKNHKHSNPISNHTVYKQDGGPCDGGRQLQFYERIVNGLSRER